LCTPSWCALDRSLDSVETCGPVVVAKTNIKEMITLSGWRLT